MGLLDGGVVALLHGTQVVALQRGQLRLGPHDAQRDAVPVGRVVSLVVQLRHGRLLLIPLSWWKRGHLTYL